MKSNFRFRSVALALLVGLAATTQAAYDENVRQALQSTMDDAGQSLQKASLPAKTVTVLGLIGDQDRYVEGLLKNSITTAGLTYVDGKALGTAWFDAVAVAMEQMERKGDFLDPESLVELGKLKMTQLLLYGFVRQADVSGKRVLVEVELHLSSLETRQHLWGGTFSKRFYLPGSTIGIISQDDLSEQVRATIKEALAKAVTGLKSSPKLADIRSVAVVPLAGDIDGYVLGLVNDALSQTQLYPKQLDIGTLGEARQLLRDQPQQADAVVYGAVRDLSRKLDEESPMSKRYKINAELQLQIQSAKTGEILWSSTLNAVGEEVDKLNGWEFVQQNSRAFMIGGGILLGLIVLKMFVGSMTRAR